MNAVLPGLSNRFKRPHFDLLTSGNYLIGSLNAIKLLRAHSSHFVITDPEFFGQQVPRVGVGWGYLLVVVIVRALHISFFLARVLIREDVWVLCDQVIPELLCRGTLLPDLVWVLSPVVLDGDLRL